MVNKLIVTLNGTDENPFEFYGLVCNPFPQGPMAEAMQALNSLGGPPIPNKEYIREVLKPYFTEEVIEHCCGKFRRGERVSFEVRW